MVVTPFHHSCVSFFVHFQLNEQQIGQLFARLGIDVEDGLGLAYHALVPYIMQALEQ